MAKVLISATIDAQAHALALSQKINMSKFLNESIYAYCASGLSAEAREGIPADKLLTQQLIMLQKEHAATVAELDTIKAKTDATVTDLKYQLRLSEQKIERLEARLKQRKERPGPTGRAARIAELKNRLKNPALSEDQKAGIIAEISGIIRNLPESEETAKLKTKKEGVESGK